ncbi:MAG TPA: thiamine phosphate synthase [Burkholderiales bacterium]|nr:thiamine phosphate synthase [Burkholderiales bacterium]
MLRGLYAITPECADTGRLVGLVAAALAGGARLVQYRSKAPDEALRLEQAIALRELCRRSGVPLIVNDSLDLASRSGADGVHIGRDDGTVAEARRMLGAAAIIGVSCYDRLDLAHDAEAAGADYVAFGSFFASTIKPGAPRPSIDLISRACRRLRTPVAAIGGITRDNGGRLIEAGADMIAVISAIFSAPDVQHAAGELQALFNREATGS